MSVLVLSPLAQTEFRAAHSGVGINSADTKSQMFELREKGDFAVFNV